VPVNLLRLAGLCLGQSAAIDRLTESLEINSHKADSLLGWNPPLNFEESIQMTVDDYLLNQKAV
jgi:UDP-glucose 4-epimerase